MTDRGAKILGSAQRRIRHPESRVLHHGSLVLRPPAATPDCGAVSEQVDTRALEAELHNAVVREIAAALGLRPEEGTPTDEELRLAHELAAQRYENEDFTHRR